MRLLWRPRQGAAAPARHWLAAMAALLALMPAAPAWSVPAFARATGVACAVCHTVAFGPALTPYGRNFKLHGYALGTQKTIPLSADLVASFTHTAESQPPAPHYSGNDNFAIDNVDGFFAGKIYDHFGAFADVTYDGIERHTSWNNLDARYAQDFTFGDVSTLLGVSLNNSPTVQDPWNSTPVWQFPFPPARLANGPPEPQIDGAFGSTVLGVTAYTLIDNTVYLEAGAYQTLNDHLQEDLGITSPSSEIKIDGTAPYWRAVLQHFSGPHYASVGIVGFSAHTQLPGAGASAGTNNYSDFGYDATYQFANGGDHTFNADVSYIHEDQRLFADTALGQSDTVANYLNTFKVDAQYAYRQTYALTLMYFNMDGNVNQALRQPGAWYGSATGKPDSRGYIMQLEYIPFGKAGSFASPWLNLRVGVQFTGYMRLNGGNSNYDGFGHSAADNNTLFLYFWTAI